MLKSVNGIKPACFRVVGVFVGDEKQIAMKVIKAGEQAQVKAGLAGAGFTLVEVLIALVIFGMASAGLIYGYVVANRMAEWTSMSLAAQSNASQGAERARAANWRPRDYPPATGSGTMDELPARNDGFAVFTNVDYFDVPTKGDPAATNFNFWITNYVWVTDVSTNPPLRLIRSTSIWTFPYTGKRFTNHIVLQRAPDQ